LVSKPETHPRYLYINEPRAMPAAFFKNRPETGGVREGDFTALCTSHPAVRRWMVAALAHVFRQVPGLGGVYAITASENLTNCASHGAGNPAMRAQRRRHLAERWAARVHRGNPRPTSSCRMGLARPRRCRTSSAVCPNRFG
jgi:hypothetical protein